MRATFLCIEWGSETSLSKIVGVDDVSSFYFLSHS